MKHQEITGVWKHYGVITYFTYVCKYVNGSFYRKWMATSLSLVILEKDAVDVFSWC